MMKTKTTKTTTETKKAKVTNSGADKKPATRQRAKINIKPEDKKPVPKQMTIDEINKEVAKVHEEKAKAEAEAKAKAESTPEPINLPAVYDKKYLAEITAMVGKIKKDILTADKSLIKVGFKVYWLYESEAYKAQAFKNIEEMTEKLFGFKKTTTYNYINIVDRFGNKTLKLTDKVPGAVYDLKDEYKDYNLSQLVAMTELTDEEIAQLGISPEWSVRDIKKAIKDLDKSNGTDSLGTGEDSGDDSDNSGSDKNPGDIEVEAIQLQQIISFRTVEELENCGVDKLLAMIKGAFKLSKEIKIHYVVEKPQDGEKK